MRDAHGRLSTAIHSLKLEIPEIEPVARYGVRIYLVCRPGNLGNNEGRRVNPKRDLTIIKNDVVKIDGGVGK